MLNLGSNDVFCYVYALFILSGSFSSAIVNKI